MVIGSKPYTDTNVSLNAILRNFDENIDPIELMWHRDEEDRLIESVYPTDWQFQLEDELPKDINRSIFIPRYVWHRLIKGSKGLTLRISKIENETIKTTNRSRENQGW